MPDVRLSLHKVALWVWYRGADFAGFQAQAGLRTVQGEVLHAFARAGLPRNPVAAARTDKGVNARMQVLVARMPSEKSLADVEASLSPLWPDDIGLVCSAAVADSFHPAFSASRKRYAYRLPPLTPQSLSRFDDALALTVGTRDFSVFHFKTSAAQPRTVCRAERVDEVAWLEGVSFGRHMVRMLVGGALAVANGEVPLSVFARGLTHQEKFHCPVAPAAPLTLWEVCYPPALDPFTEKQRQAVATMVR
jgi:tRNA pseudouridine38-40 synthase